MSSSKDSYEVNRFLVVEDIVPVEMLNSVGISMGLSMSYD